MTTTEWHLTESGWVRGSMKDEGETAIRKEPPINRFLTCSYSEKSHTGSIAVEGEINLIWTSNLPEINDFKDRFGECPNRL